MSLCCCNKKIGCVGLAAIASLIIGIVAAFLQIGAVITVTPAFLWVVFGIAVVYLAVLLIAMALRDRDNDCRCLCSTLAALLIGILGTVLFSVILLAIEFAATSVLGAIFVGLLLFSFSLTLGSSACLVKCLADCDD